MAINTQAIHAAAALSPCNTCKRDVCLRKSKSAKGNRRFCSDLKEFNIFMDRAVSENEISSPCKSCNRRKCYQKIPPFHYCVAMEACKRYFRRLRSYYPGYEAGMGFVMQDVFFERKEDRSINAV